MKIKWGPTQAELYTKHKLAHEKVALMENWHDHFAWLPVFLAPGEYRWLETVQRKFLFWHINEGGNYPEYREKNDQ